MKKLSRNKLLAGVLTGLLLFSNYGVMGFADGEETPLSQTEEVGSIVDIAPVETGVTPAELNVLITETPEADENGNEMIDKTVKYNNTGTPGKTITEEGEHWYNSDENHSSSVLNLKDKNEIVNGYCNDLDTNLKKNSEYKVEELSKDDSGEKLRGIVQNGYDPQESVSDYLVRLELDTTFDKTKLNGLTQEEAIAATQMAVWKLDNPGKDFVVTDPSGLFGWGEKENKNVTNLAKYLSDQKESAPSNHDVEIVENDAERKIVLNDEKIETSLNYSVVTKGNEKVINTIFKVFLGDDSTDMLTLGEHYDINEETNGSQTLVLKNITTSIKKATVEISGTYEVEDVYDLEPVKGNPPN